MKFYYTALGAFDGSYDGNGLSWQKYLEWSKLTHLIELISLDRMLNEDLVEPNYDNPDDWNYIVTDDFITHFFTSLDYVLQKLEKKEKFNLLAVIIEPTQDCRDVDLEDFEFVGYDLLDKEYGNSALTNCGGFEETFLPSDLNRFGLIDDHKKAFDVKQLLSENNPEEHHANTNVIAIWRHKTIGKIKPNRYS